MLRPFYLLLLVAMIGAATVTYQIKHHAEETLAEVRILQAEIRLEEQTLDLLKADWSLLTQPSRLQKLSQIYQAELALQPLEAHQVIGLDELPPKPLTIEDLSSQHLGGMADSGGAAVVGQDEIVTGGVVQ